MLGQSVVPEAPRGRAMTRASCHFGPGSNGPLIVTADLLTSTDPDGVMNGLKAEIEKLPGVASVPAALPNQNADTGFVQVIPTTAPDDPATKDVVNALDRAVPALAGRLRRRHRGHRQYRDPD